MQSGKLAEAAVHSPDVCTALHIDLVHNRVLPAARLLKLSRADVRLQYCRSNRRHLKPMALQRQARPRRCASGEGHSERCEIRAAEITQVRIGMRSAPIRNSLKRDSQGGAKRRRAEVGCSVRALPRAVVGHIGRPVSHFSSATANVGERGRQKARALSGVACGVGGVSSEKFSLDTRESRQCTSCRDGRSRTQRFCNFRSVPRAARN